ncbi:MAG: hypothetical protein M1318_01990 [Firmicutes bacterium]|nr:hypothetical protein [Bacillota bacterium]
MGSENAEPLLVQHGGRAERLGPIVLVFIGQALMAMIFVAQSKWVHPTVLAQLKYQLIMIPWFLVGNTIVGYGYNIGGRLKPIFPFIWLMVIGFVGGSVAGLFGSWGLLAEQPTIRMVIGLVVALAGIMLMNT